MEKTFAAYLIAVGRTMLSTSAPFREVIDRPEFANTLVNLMAGEGVEAGQAMARLGLCSQAVKPVLAPGAASGTCAHCGGQAPLQPLVSCDVVVARICDSCSTSRLEAVFYND